MRLLPSEILAEHLQDATYLYAPGGEYDRSVVHADMSEPANRTAIDRLFEIGDKLDKVDYDDAGLNGQGVAKFFESHGLASKPFMVVDEAGQQDINDIMGFGRGATSTIAAHFPLFGISYVRRTSSETEADTIGRQLSHAHENGHANQRQRTVLLYPDDSMAGQRHTKLLRNGFVTRDADGRRGDYYEEGFGSLMAHKFLTDELGMCAGEANRTEPLKVDGGTVPGYLLPGSYVWKDPETGRDTWSPSAHASFGLQLMVANDPELFPAILDSRNDVEGLDDVVQHIEKLVPGLHASLNKLSYSQDRFITGTRLIIDHLFGGKPLVALDAALEQDYAARSIHSGLLAA